MKRKCLYLLAIMAFAGLGSQAKATFSTFGTISTSGTVSNRFGVGSNFSALAFAAPDLGYGPNLLYFLRHDATGFSTFGTISTSGAVTDRFGVGFNFNALAFAAPDLGYGPNLFYFLRTLSFAQATENLVAQVNAASLSNGIQNALTSSLQAAIDSFNNGNNTAGVNQLKAFQSKVSAQRGKKIDAALADALIAGAQLIINAGG